MRTRNFGAKLLRISVHFHFAPVLYHILAVKSTVLSLSSVLLFVAFFNMVLPILALYLGNPGGMALTMSCPEQVFLKPPLQVSFILRQLRQPNANLTCSKGDFEQEKVPALRPSDETGLLPCSNAPAPQIRPPSRKAQSLNETLCSIFAPVLLLDELTALKSSLPVREMTVYIYYGILSFRV